MFCRFGFAEESRPVAVPVWPKVVCRRPVARVDQRRQRVDVSGLQLGELAVVEDHAGNGMIFRQSFQHIDGR